MKWVRFLFFFDSFRIVDAISATGLAPGFKTFANAVLFFSFSVSFFQFFTTGLGKTIQTLALAAVNQPPRDWLDSPLFQRGEAEAGKVRDITWSPVAVRSTLIVAPMTLIDQWTSEIQKFFQQGTLTYAIYRPKKGMQAIAESTAQPVQQTPATATRSLDTDPQKAGPRRGRRQRRGVQKFTFPDPETEPRKNKKKSAPPTTETNFARVIAIAEGTMLADPDGNFIPADKLRKPEDFPQVIFCSYVCVSPAMQPAHFIVGRSCFQFACLHKTGVIDMGQICNASR